MNKEELLKEYDEKAKALRDEFIAKLEDDNKEFELTYPEDRETVYFINSVNTEIYSTVYFSSNRYDKIKFEKGLYFDTKEEAEQFIKEQTLIKKIKCWAKEKNEGWELDWKDEEEMKYCIQCKNMNTVKELNIDWYFTLNKIIKLPYFKTQEIVQACIGEFGEEIKEVFC